MNLFHLALVIVAACGFLFDAYQNPAPTRVSCVSAAVFVASMLA